MPSLALVAPEWVVITSMLATSTLVCYGLAWIANSTKPTLDWYRLVVFMAVSFAVMVLCEAASAHIYQTLAGEPLWEYRMWPLHHGYSTGWGWLVWPFYGMYMYFLDAVLAQHGVALKHPALQGLCMGVDGVLIELCINAFTVGVFGVFYFYYFPGDLWHFSSLWAVPFYAVSGAVLGMACHWALRQPRSWAMPAGWYSSGVVALLALAYS